MSERRARAREVAGTGGTAAARGGLAGRTRKGARGERALAAHATRARLVPVASGTQRGKHARAQAQAHDKEEEGKRNKARGTALAASGFSEEFWRRTVFKSRVRGEKMDAAAVVLKELKSGRNSDRLANALSLLTSLS